MLFILFHVTVTYARFDEIAMLTIFLQTRAGSGTQILALTDEQMDIGRKATSDSKFRGLDLIGTYVESP